VPLARLMKNVNAHFATYQNHAEANYLLGRLESLAFSGEAKSVVVFPREDKKQLPGIAFWSWVQETHKTPIPTEVLSKRAHALFFSSIAHYQQAIALDLNNPLYHFSLGWMAELGQRFVLQVGAPLSSASWRMMAIHEYQEASRLSPVRTDYGGGLYLDLPAQSRQALEHFRNNHSP
jgi:hypothetical protein